MIFKKYKTHFRKELGSKNCLFQFFFDEKSEEYIIQNYLESKQNTSIVNATARFLVIKYYGYEDVFEKNFNHVKELQGYLFEIGYDLGKNGSNKNGIDGIFGPRTREAIKGFEKDFSKNLLSEMGQFNTQLTPSINLQNKKGIEK